MFELIYGYALVGCLFMFPVSLLITALIAVALFLGDHR